MKKHDLVIVGAGPAGMSAALNAQNDGLDFKLFESKEEGWFPRVSVDLHHTVDNYLGFSKVSGTELIESFQDHLEKNGIVASKKHVENIIRNDEMFIVDYKDSSIETDSIILATGTIQRRLEVPGVSEFLGKSVFYYCFPEAEKFVGKKVLVVGGRNTGAVTALYLKEKGCDVEIIERDPQLNSKAKYLKKVEHHKIPYHIGTQILSLEGESELERVSLQTPKGLEIVKADGVFLCIGLLPNNRLAKCLGAKLDKWDYVKVNDKMATSVPGVYAAGDVTGNLKQIVVAASQGSIAAYNVNKFLRQK